MIEVKCPICGTKRFIFGTEERVRCISKDCDKRFYTKGNIIVPEKKDNKDSNGTLKYKTTARNPPSRISVEIDYNAVLKCMERGISTIKNKPEVKAKAGAYYWDYLKWVEQFNILKTLKMGDEE